LRNSEVGRRAPRSLKVQAYKTVLFLAKKIGHEGVHTAASRPSQLLLDNGFDINADSSKLEGTLLWAAKNGYRATVLMLLKANADINLRDNFGERPLSKAAEMGPPGGAAAA
jgi:ankyrin repeat protein